jgi:hypothetical protein
MEHFDRIEAAGPRPDFVDDDGRCSGLVICESCGRELYDHPSHPFDDWMTITCEGKIVKL